jgi:peroxiredoxin
VRAGVLSPNRFPQRAPKRKEIDLVSDAKETDNLEQAFVEHAARLAAMTFPDALRVGEKAPNFELPNARGQNVELNSLLANGPVVLVFYRGAWCPYCNAQLRALQDSLEEISALGATLVAVSPQAPDASAAFADVAGLSFEVLSDLGSFVASDYGLSFELAEPDRALFLAVGNDLTKVNGSDSWILPVPAIYVVATDGLIKHAAVNPNFAERPPVSEIMVALREVRLQSTELEF